MRTLMLRWYGGDSKYIPVASRLYVLVIKDITQWLENNHSIKKYIKIHFPKHFDEIYEHRTDMKEILQSALTIHIPSIEDERIMGRLINVIDKIFSDICKGNLEKSIRANREYWQYFDKLIKVGFKTEED